MNKNKNTKVIDPQHRSLVSSSGCKVDEKEKGGRGTLQSGFKSVSSSDGMRRPDQEKLLPHYFVSSLPLWHSRVENKTLSDTNPNSATNWSFDIRKSPSAPWISLFAREKWLSYTWSFQKVLFCFCFVCYVITRSYGLLLVHKPQFANLGCYSQWHVRKNVVNIYIGGPSVNLGSVNPMKGLPFF